MTQDNMDQIVKIGTAIAVFTVPIFLGFIGYQAKRYADKHRGSLLGEAAYYIALGIEQKYGKNISNDEKKDIAVKAQTDKKLQSELLAESGVAQMNGIVVKTDLQTDDNVHYTDEENAG